MTLTALGRPVRQWLPLDRQHRDDSSVGTVTPVDVDNDDVDWLVEVQDGPDLRPFMYWRSVVLSAAAFLVGLILTAVLYVTGSTVAFMFSAEVTVFLLAVVCAMGGRYLLTRPDGTSRHFLKKAAPTAQGG